MESNHPHADYRSAVLTLNYSGTVSVYRTPSALSRKMVGTTGFEPVVSRSRNERDEPDYATSLQKMARGSEVAPDTGFQSPASAEPRES
jgi:hypothetical protein